MTRKTARIIGMDLLAAAAGFVVFALGHPERTFPGATPSPICCTGFTLPLRYFC